MKVKVRSMVVRQTLPLAIVLGLGAPSTEFFALVAAQPAVARSPVALKLRHSGDRVDLILAGVGEDALVVGKKLSPHRWQGRLQVKSPFSLGSPQEATLSSAGLRSVRLSQNHASELELLVTSTSEWMLPRPQISANGQDLIVTFGGGPSVEPVSTTGQLDLQRPGRVAQPTVIPPIRPRAVAPPLGDMAVGTMVVQNRSYVNVSGPDVTMNMNNAPAGEVLRLLAKLGGYNFAFVDDSVEDKKIIESKQTDRVDIEREYVVKGFNRYVNASFNREKFDRAFNTILLSTGLSAILQGETILVGPKIQSKSLGLRISKVFRMNQASAQSAADYLASLGAKITKIRSVSAIGENSGIDSKQQQSVQIGAGPQNGGKGVNKQDPSNTYTYGADVGPLLGVTGTTDSRLQTITLIGSKDLIILAEAYLKQIDLRQRQVALSVKMLDVSLADEDSIKNSFAFRYGNNFIVNDEGRLLGAFGEYVPPSMRRNPGLQYPKNTFYDYMSAQIESSSTKVLATPTLIINENPEFFDAGRAEVPSSVEDIFMSSYVGRPKANESFVTVGTRVITDYKVSAGQNGAPNTCQPVFSTAGLTFGAKVTKIDDNGFVTFTVSPALSAVTGTQNVQGCGPISILSLRRLDTGSLRVRDGQTLVMTGVISDSDIQRVRKWPILGDIPLIGQFFRDSNGQKRKNELVIMVTPRIIADGEGGDFGYGYAPVSSSMRRVISK